MASASASLTILPIWRANVTAVAATTGDLTTQIQLAGSIAGQASASAALTALRPIFSNAAVVATGQGDLTTQIRMSGACAAVASTSMSLFIGSDWFDAVNIAEIPEEEYQATVPEEDFVAIA